MKRTVPALKHAIALLLVGLLYHQPSLAQVDPWERIKLIEQGKRVNVTLHSGKTVKGRMESWTADGLSVRQGKDKVVPVAKSEVARVAMVTGMSRGRKASYAGLITGGILGGLWGGLCAAEGCDVSGAAAVVAVAGFFGGIAAGIAALFPPHNEVIYTAQAAPFAAQFSETLNYFVGKDRSKEARREWYGRGVPRLRYAS